MQARKASQSAQASARAVNAAFDRIELVTAVSGEFAYRFG